MTSGEIIPIAVDLDKAGLVWNPEIGDEVTERAKLERVSILVDPYGMTPRELRDCFLWLPTVEQLVEQLEARQALIYHVGVNNAFTYEAVIRASCGVIEASAASLRATFGIALQELLRNSATAAIH